MAVRARIALAVCLLLVMAGARPAAAQSPCRSPPIRCHSRSSGSGSRSTRSGGTTRRAWRRSRSDSPNSPPRALRRRHPKPRRSRLRPPVLLHPRRRSRRPRRRRRHPSRAGTCPRRASSPNAFAKVFNPDIAVIGNFLGAAGKNHVEDSPALQLNEAEASFQAVVDPYARADFFLSFGPDGVEVEEGFITFTTLPGRPARRRSGKMRGAVRQGEHDAHARAAVDRPAARDAQPVGGDEGISDAGHLGVAADPEPARCSSRRPARCSAATSGRLPGAASARDLSYVGHLRGYRDLTEATNLDLGGVVRVRPQRTLEPSTSTHARLVGVDATFRYRPLRRAIYRRFLGADRAGLEPATGRVGRRRRPRSACTRAASTSSRAAGSPARRYDYSERAARRRRWSTRAAPLSSPSGRASSARCAASTAARATREGVTANEFLFQFLFSIGAHGAHVF